MPTKRIVFESYEHTQSELDQEIEEMVEFIRQQNPFNLMTIKVED